ncbi:hypothetical protein EV182_001627 [Spiromyces aspiralis]|uniref:Uncharacterized protein n=1 Tax=Spiromyces aspiralis TaxID=68401 RepID=A0ACC1HX05_9FUNG|nr:hypothetical protein EV182_001627 [Spiromyces aspiralis]
MSELTEPIRSQSPGIAEYSQDEPSYADTSVGANTNNAGPDLSRLTDEERQAIEKAKAYAQELQSTVFKDVESVSASALPSGILNPGLAAGVDPRSLSLLSRIYVGSINFEMTDEHIRKVFGEFGAIKSISLTKDPTTGRHKGFGFVEYDVPEAASLAIETMNGQMVGGRQLRVGRTNSYAQAVSQGYPSPPKERIYVANVNEQVTEENMRTILKFEDAKSAKTAADAMNGFELGNQRLRVRLCVVGGPLGEGMSALSKLPQPNLPKVALPKEVLTVAESINRSIDTGASAAPDNNAEVVTEESIDDDGDIKINAEQRQRIMQQLSHSEEDSPVVCLTNIATPEEVDDELAVDIYDECSKYGPIVKIVTHLSKPDEISADNIAAENDERVKVFIQYQYTEGARNAIKTLHKRWFGGKQIMARLYDEEKYRLETSTDIMVFTPQ